MLNVNHNIDLQSYSAGLRSENEKRYQLPLRLEFLGFDMSNFTPTFGALESRSDSAPLFILRERLTSIKFQQTATEFQFYVFT